MAGDILIHEHLVISEPGAAAAASRAVNALGGRVIHRYGERVHIIQAPGPEARGLAAPALVRAAAAAVPRSLLDQLDEIERLGILALQTRQSEEYLAAKQRRPRQGEPWEMHACTEVAPPPALGELAGAPAPAGAPTSAYLEGSVAVGIIIVEGPTAALQFSQTERTNVVAEVQNGLSFYAARNSAAALNFTYDIQIVQVNVQSNPNAPDLEALWRDPAMAILGYSASWSGVTQYVEDIRTRFNTRWTYCGFFTKYPLGWFAYASIGGPRLVMDYNNDGWGTDNIDRVFAHESGHIFGCPDEYASSNCDCAGSWGRWGQPNLNCENCASGGGVTCIMRSNDWAMCPYTPGHLGWVPGVSGNPALVQSRFGVQGNFELVVPLAAGGLGHFWRDNDSTFAWEGPFPFGQGLGMVDAVTMIQSNFGSPGNLEVIARVGSQLLFFWRDSGPALAWDGPYRVP